jgi:hypothetical protein
MAQLTDAQKTFVVVRLACFDQPSEVVEAVNQDFGVQLPRQQVMKYDPTTKSGENLSAELKELFHSTRERFLSNVQEIPIANQAYRLRELQKLYQTAPKANAHLRANLLEQAAKESGGAFTNKVQVFQQLARDVEKLSDADLLARIVGGGAPPAVLPGGSPTPGLVVANGNGKHSGQ